MTSTPAARSSAPRARRPSGSAAPPVRAWASGSPRSAAYRRSCSALGTFLVIWFTFMDPIGQAAITRADRMSEKKIRLEQQAELKKLLPKGKKSPSNSNEDEKKKYDEEAKKINEDYEKKADDAKEDAAITEVDVVRSIWFDKYGQLFGFVFLAFGCIGYLRTEQPLVMQIVAATVLALMLLMIFNLAAGGCSGPRPCRGAQGRLADARTCRESGRPYNSGAVCGRLDSVSGFHHARFEYLPGSEIQARPPQTERRSARLRREQARHQPRRDEGHRRATQARPCPRRAARHRRRRRQPPPRRAVHRRGRDDQARHRRLHGHARHRHERPGPAGHARSDGRADAAHVRGADGERSPSRTSAAAPSATWRRAASSSSRPGPATRSSPPTPPRRSAEPSSKSRWS